MRDRNYFNQLFELSPVPTVVLSGRFPHLIIKDANTAYAKLTGRSRAQLSAKPFFLMSPHPAMHLDKAGHSDVMTSLEKVYLNKTIITTPIQKFIKAIPHSDDFETLYLEATNTPVLDRTGEVDFVIRTMQNVTDIFVAAEKERLKDQQLIKNERFLNDAQQVAKIGTWEIDKDDRFYWSPIHYEIMEVEPNTPITVPLATQLLKRQIDKDIFKQIYDKAVRNGDSFDVELNVNTAKGNERWVRFIGKGELKDGQFERMYGIAQDITEQKLLRHQLTDFSSKLESIIQTVDGVVFECNAQTLAFTFVSEQIHELFGYTPEECISQPDFLLKILHPNDVDEILTHTAHQIVKGELYAGDYRIISKNGEMKWIKVSVSIIEEEGNLKWLRGLMIDITSSKRISELERIEKDVLELNADPDNTTTAYILEKYLQGIESIFPEMQCAIMQVKNGQLHNWVANSLPPAYLAAIDHLTIANGVGSCGTAAFRNETTIVSDIATDSLWASYKEVALQYNLKACWSQPLRNESGEVIATLGMYFETVKSPTEEQLKIIDRTAHLLQVILQHRHTLELLKDTNLLMEQSQEIAHFGSVQLDVNTRELTWSKELHTIFGLDEHIIPTVELYYNLLHPDDKERITAVIQQAIKTKTNFVTEERIIRPNGEVRNLQSWGSLKTDEHGELVKIISTYLDITENKKIQEELMESESRLRSLVDSQTNYVIRIDFNENYTYVNKKYIEDFATPACPTPIGTNALAFVIPGQENKIRETINRCLSSLNEVVELELEKYGNDGSVKSTFWHFVCLTNSKGEPREIQCIGIDISDLKRAEHERENKAVELEKSERRYSDLFHLSPQPMFVCDPDSLQFLDVNQAAVEQYGYARDEFFKMKMEDVQQGKTSLQSHIKKEDFSQAIYMHRLKSGEEIFVDIKLTKIPFQGKMVDLFLAINITEPITYLQALEEQNILLSEIAWVQSHEVRAPLAHIIALVDILQHYDNTAKENEFMLDQITSSALKLDEVIIDIIRKAERVTDIPAKKNDS